MKKFKVLALSLLMMGLISVGNTAQASGIGYINYKKVQDSCSFAKDAVKQVDSKALELQQYLVDKEKEFKALDTPIKKKNFEDATAKEFKTKQDAYLKLKTQKEDEVYTKIQNAARDILVEQKLDAVIDFRVIFVGGIDITDLVIQKLNGGK